jgi:hypothetical protein
MKGMRKTTKMWVRIDGTPGEIRNDARTVFCEAYKSVGVKMAEI